MTYNDNDHQKYLQATIVPILKSSAFSTNCEEFREMVAALHQKHLGVVMDVVFNHTLGSGPETEKSRVAELLLKSGWWVSGDSGWQPAEVMSRESENQNCMAGSLFALRKVFPIWLICFKWVAQLPTRQGLKSILLVMSTPGHHHWFWSVHCFRHHCNHTKQQPWSVTARPCASTILVAMLQ